MANRRRDAASGPGGARPARQRGTSSPDARPSPSRTRRSLGRLVVTPTFFAGACIVLAAALAYTTSRTHLAFRGVGPACGQVSCSTAGPGKTEVTRSRKATAPRGANANRGSGRAAAPRVDAPPKTGRLAGDATSIAAAPGLPVVIAYRTVRVWPGGFAGTMKITNRSDSAIRNWLLFVSYRRARMDHIWGAHWYPASPHVRWAGVVAPRHAESVLRPGASVEFTFRASGHAGPPAGCFFDTSRCRFHRSRR